MIRTRLRMLSKLLKKVSRPLGPTAWYAMAAIDTLPRLGCVRAPTLCLAGELDKSSPPEIVKEMTAAIPGARYAELKGAPHMLFLEQPEATARVVGDFLRNELKRHD